MNRRLIAVISSVLLSLGLTGCFFGMATVGGTLTGLPSGTSVVLQNNGSDDLLITQDGRFTFSRTLKEGKGYDVTVLTAPAGASCTVTNGRGTINSKLDDVDNVQVSCAVSGTLTGTIAGIPTSAFVTLLNNGATPLQVTANGGFAFPGILSNGTAYDVTVQLPLPTGITTCNVTNGSGNVVTGTPTNIGIVCS